MLPIEVDLLDELIMNNQINSSFEYLENEEVMYYVIKKRPNLISLLNNETKKKIARLLKLDYKLEDSVKKNLFMLLVEYYNNIPDNFIKLLDKEDYLSLASKNLKIYSLLYNKKHPYKDLEEELFYSLYENNYIFNPENPLSYAQKSSIVLLNTLKQNNMFIYYISYFSKEAVNDEVVKYLDESNLINNINIPVMYISPKIIILKLQRDLNFWYQLTSNCFTDEVIEYLEDKDLDQELLDLYFYTKKNYNDPVSSKFILMLLKKDIKNIKYVDKNNIDKSIYNYLNQIDYIYQKKHSDILLKDINIFKKFINNGGLDYIFNKDVFLNEEQIEIVYQKIINENINYHFIKNMYLLKSNLFNKLSTFYKIENPLNIKEKYLTGNLGSTLNILNKFFSRNDIEIIMREIINNNYYINMVGILDNIDIYKFKEIYDKLYNKESKFNNNFNFYFFIKVTEYFGNNLSLVKELNSMQISDNIINNLSLAINSNDYINGNDLINYQNIYKNRIVNSNLNVNEKIFKLLVNGNRNEVYTFLVSVIKPCELLYLQLEFENSSFEYKILDLYYKIVKLLEDVYLNDCDVNELYSDILKEYDCNSMFDLKIMKDNILKIYAMLYKRQGINKEKLISEGKYEKVNGSYIFDISEEDFVLFLHTENFNNNEDNYDNNSSKKSENKKNYICTCLISPYHHFLVSNEDTYIYNMDDINSLIAFGNKDIFINHTKTPLFVSTDSFTNPIDINFIYGKGYTQTEFDFLRYDNHNNKLKPAFKVADNIEEARKIAKQNPGMDIIIYDIKRIYEHQINKLNYLCQNISTLSYKELYTLISMFHAFQNNSLIFLNGERYKEEIIKRIDEMPLKEQIVLNDALIKYNFNIVNRIRK